MGLDFVEFVVAVEEAFGIAIPDKDAQDLITPGHLAQYLEHRLVAGQGPCLEQRAFHVLRRAGIAVLGCPRSTIRPATLWEDVLPVDDRRRAWARVHQATGIGPWPGMPFWRRLPVHRTLGDTARFLATYAPATLQPPGSGWSRSQIESTIRGLMVEQLGIAEFEWHHRFVDELRID